MNCPTCKIALETKSAGPVEVDACPQCQGVWYEGEELRLAKDASDSDLNWLDFEIWKDWDSLELKLKKMACPGCNQNLVGVRYAKTPVEVDCCPACKAIWLEEGELAAIVDALKAEVVSKPFSAVREGECPGSGRDHNRSGISFFRVEGLKDRDAPGAVQVARRKSPVLEDDPGLPVVDAVLMLPQPGRAGP